MDMSGEQRIPAPRAVVWRALNDPEVLKVCIPGCQELVKTSDTAMAATVVLKVGPVSARFQGAVTLSDLDPPASYRIIGEGQGGVAGFARGEAVVRLEEDGADTLLRYEVTAQVGGKLAQLGARLIDATAKQMSAAFFKRFAQEIAAQQAEEGAGPASGAGAAGDAGTVDAPKAVAAPAPARTARGVPAGTPVGPGAWRPGQLLLLLVAAVLAGYAGSELRGAASGAAAGALSPDLVGAALLILAGAVGYLFGRLGGGGERTGAP
ncbi:carbon monoxide dehydrogenase subunit G [Xanthobacter autotrophicus DSM 431]|uniref:SRPBCC family protein n=1 Tax=Xanthobacter nonsaccharivorans TaxID=3119912 RepID=UPI00372665A1